MRLQMFGIADQYDGLAESSRPGRYRRPCYIESRSRVAENLLQMKAFLLMMKLSSLSASLFAISVAGCSSLPTAGPTASEIIDQETVQGVRHFDIIKIDNRVVGILSAEPAAACEVGLRNTGSRLPPV